ncbi:hypothetical protein [uncultured Fibrella sp.]|uniref:hypothetical protein n=1 Tax=uncultured Fibrella sp. TaxID=1284596 RepID=UPI0035C9679C
MKTLSYTLVFSLMLVMSHMSSCSRDVQLVSAGNSIPSQAISNLGGESFKGKVSIHSSTDGNITFLVSDMNFIVTQPKLARQNKAVPTKQAFVLQRPSSSSNESIDLEMVDAEVIMLPSFIMVSVPQKGSRYIFRVDGPITQEYQDRLVGTITEGSNIYIGYGLSVRTGIVESTATSYYKNVVNKRSSFDGTLNVGDGGGGGVACESGGVGSTSCSSTFGDASCSTSCGTGYYACCRAGATSCKCEPNPPKD